ncbi:MAG: Ig-like domain-containing protein [Microbacterium sp.]|uniref:Ig-like domain-containing protein n=1 Tax=Microbacterium sp. TaxID=51671 RepID=UPI0039E4308D
MKSFAWLRARPRTLASVGILSASAVAIATMAFLHEGHPTTEVDLHDGGVWITKQSSMLVGHFNHPSRVIDSGLRTPADDYDVLQAGNTVLVHETTGVVTTVDPSLVVLADSASVPAGATVALGGKTVAIMDAQSGALWVVPAAGVAGFELEGTKPLVKLGAGAAVAVGVDGTVHAVSVEKRAVVTIPVDADGAPQDPSTSTLDGLAKGAQASITAVGDIAVVLDAATGGLFWSGGHKTTVADGAVLQQPSAAAPSVVLATPAGLVQAPLDGSDPVETPAGAEGAPAEPVSLNGCVYGAWAASARFVRDCAGDDDDLRADIPDVDDQAVLRFRVNRDVVVLNDTFGGTAWLANDDLQQVDNWDDLTPPEGDSEQDEEETSDETVETTLPERTEQNTPPVAENDSFGVRPGRTTVLPVLDNDNDPDGDVLTVSLPDDGPSLGSVELINNGAGLQISVPEDASGRATFAYEADDGRHGTDRATVTLTVRDWSENTAPEQKRKPTIAVESGGVVAYNVLPDWIDPDGDDVFLASVTAEQGDEVDFTPDGRVTYRAVGGSMGRKDVPVTVSDGSKVTEGVLRLDVRPQGTTVPVTTADHVVARVGETVTVSPLDNDISSGKERLRLTRVDDVKGAKTSFDPVNGTFTFSAGAAQTYYVQYLASAGANGVPGVVRVDVVEDRQNDDPPIAVRDVALLPSGGEVLVDVLANDIDPAGGILVVQSVTMAPGSGISVSVLGHETLRIADQAALGEQVVVSYRISNGAKSAEGSVVVIPVPAPSKIRPPVAEDDTAIVRVGDVVTIPVLSNDYSPSGSPIHVLPDLVPPLPEESEGTVFVSQDTVRFLAGDEPGTVYATYQVADETGQQDAGYVKIQVLPRDDEANAAPRPREVTARVLAGSTVRIPIELNGIDPDGDSVELVGLAGSPSKGRVEVGADHLVYQALDASSGVDRFSFRVRDRLGKEATASVTVGIAPAESMNQAPYAVKDSIVMRPGRSVAVPVLQNDSDPDGDLFGLVSSGLVLPDVPGLSAKVAGDRVIVTSPDRPLETSLQYTVADERGTESTAVLQVTVKEDVPLSSPIARDDRVLAQDVRNATVDVRVLDNDEDPDGTREALTVSVDGEGARVVSGGVVRVTLDETARLLAYTVTDEDGLEASAFVFVPSLDELPPTLASTEPLVVESGETVELPLADHVRAWSGDGVVLTEHDRVQALHANGDDLVKDQRTLAYTSADGYFGDDALVFEVTDGDGPDDPKGNKATLTVPITVLPPENQPPAFTDGQIEVAPGEEPVSLDLGALTDDPDPGDLERIRYEVVDGVPSGLTAEVDGQTLRVSASADTATDTVASIRVRLDDGEAEAVTGTVSVRVGASTRPLPTANDDRVPEAHQGETVEVRVLENDFNPFPETPLVVTTAIVESGSGEVVSVSGTSVSVQPDPAFVGTMVVRYRVQDATGDRDREAEGRIRLTVKGKPDAPGRPTVASVQDRTVVLSWTPPIDNGAAITGYTVTSTKGGYTKQCAATTCTLNGLTNNVEYNFVVTATNLVGTSEPSAASETARPDARPDTPQPPTLKFGDGSLRVAWDTPPTPGSPVDSFSLEISPAPPSGVARKTGVKGESLTWEGLENGVAYQVRVRAHNRAPEPSEWSGWSAIEVPAREPDAAAAPTVTRLQPVGEQSQLKVSWTAPANNGDAISGSTLEVRRGSSVVRTVSISGSETSQAVTVDNSSTDYTFRVRSSNKAGWGAWSSLSSPLRAFGNASAPTKVVATPGNNRVSVTYKAASGNGATASELHYEYSVNNGAWRSDWDGETITSGVANNGTYSVRVRAYATIDGVRFDGDASAASNTVAPYGPIGDPGAAASSSGTNITFSWSAPSRNGRDISKMEIRIDDGSWQTVKASGNKTESYGYSETHKVTVRATDAEGQTSTNSASARTSDPPEPTYTISKGRTDTVMENCSHSSCARLRLNVSNFPSGNYQVNCFHSEAPNDPFAGRRYDIPEDGSVDLTCYIGFPGREVWAQIVGVGSTPHFTWY